MNAHQYIADFPAQNNFHNYLQTKVFGSLDGIRAIAVFAVLWHHTGSFILSWPITTRGFLGVDLFFIISGFLISTLLLRELQKKGRVSLKYFYIRRFLRIFPAYYLMLLIVGTTAFLTSGNSSSAVKHDLFFAAFYISNLVPMHSMLAITWSLSAEEQFYLVAPLAIKCIRHALLPFLILAYILVSLPPFGYFPSVALPSFFKETTFGPILLGVVLAKLLNNECCFTWFSKAIGRTGSPILALIILLIISNHPKDDISGWHRLFIHWAMLAFVASCVIREKNILHNILALPPIQRIGKVSYGMYLYHLIVAHFISKGIKVTNIEWGQALFAGTMITTWVVAELSYRYYETPFLSMKARFGSESKLGGAN